jgi:membrane protein YqaA with SNARE-associated domain
MGSNTGRIYNWAIQRTESSRAPLWIGLLFFLELILFIPLDAILLFFCLQKRSRIPYYVLIAAIASTISGLCGYLLGHLLWDLIGPYVTDNLIAASSFDRFAGHYQDYENWAVFGGSLLPFPLKILSLSAGIFHLKLAPFLGFLFLGRALRFSLIGITMYFWGEKVKAFVDRHFNRLLLLIGAKVALGLTFFWALAN